MAGWTEAELRLFFGSGGALRPASAVMSDHSVSAALSAGDGHSSHSPADTHGEGAAVPTRPAASDGRKDTASSPPSSSAAVAADSGASREADAGAGTDAYTSACVGGKCDAVGEHDAGADGALTIDADVAAAAAVHMKEVGSGGGDVCDGDGGDGDGDGDEGTVCNVVHSAKSDDNGANANDDASEEASEIVIAAHAGTSATTACEGGLVSSARSMTVSTDKSVAPEDNLTFSEAESAATGADIGVSETIATPSAREP
eukprot:6210562-Pleurochrysis_carterae.AAC.10